MLDLVLCASGEPPNNQEYRLLLEGNQVALSRGSGGQVTQLAAGQCAWQAQQWHDLAVQVMSGQVAVHVNNQAVLTATDPQPPPAGTVGFILPQGGGAAIDDLYVSTPQTGGPIQQPAQPPTMQPAGQPRVQAVDTSILLQAILPRLQQAGVTNGQQLVERIRDRPSLIQLSGEVNVAQEELLQAAAVSELGRVLGPQTVAQNLAVLQVLDIDRPEDLARFQAQPEALQRMAARVAAAVGAQPPDLATVQGWLAAASQGSSQIPPAQDLLQQRLPPPAPARVVNLTPPPMATASSMAEIPQGLMDVQGRIQQLPGAGGGAARVNAPAGGGNAEVALTPMQPPDIGAMMELGLHRLTVSIPAGQSAYSGQFLADRPGLYRLHCRFSRPGGMATLKWFIDRPQEMLQLQDGGHGLANQRPTPVLERSQALVSATPRVVGWQPLIQGAGELRAEPQNTETDHYAYFWLRASDVPMTGRLQLRLEVTQNLKLVTTQDQIEGAGTGTVPAQGPVNGTVMATWVKPLVTELGKSVRLGPNEFPLSVVETSMQPSPAEQAGGGTWELTAYLDRVPPAPLMQDQFGNVVYSPAEPTNLWKDVQVLYNGAPVPAQPLASPPPGTPPRALHRCVQAPKGGVYSLLVSPEGAVALEQLAMSGKVYSYTRAFDQASNQWQQQPRYAGVQQVEAGFLSRGGSRMSIVAELVGLELKNQFEGEKGYDSDGEFHVECTTSLIRTPNIAGAPTGAIDEIYDGAQVWARTRGWPVFGASVGRSVRIPTDAQGRTIIYPRYLLAEWIEGSEQYNAGSAALAVWEEDTPSYWDISVKVLYRAIKRLAKIFIAAYSADLVKATQGLVEHVNELCNYTPTDEDDIVGYPALGWDETCVFPGADFTAFTMRAASDPAYTTVMQSGQAAWMTDVAPGGDPPAVSGHVMMRRIPAYWARADARLLSFTLSQDLDDGNDPTDVIVLKGNSNFTSDRGWSEHLYPTAVAGGYTSAQVHPAQANQRVEVEPDSPPPALAQVVQQYGLGQSAAFYIEWDLWDQDPGGDDTHIATFSRTFYYHDFLKNAGQKGQWQYLDGGQTRVSYYREGANYVGHFILDAPGGYLKQLEVKVYARIFEG
ncbi:MAG: hypothetical protein ACP5JJ_20185 [Anaerolineae bacterium]